ncbi:MAG: SusC/RagA family TonB-linked outer membrane protein, partial [Bacteroidales bacterium]|nr:SusC/RagA family TonB-linked outer membrane protein [Bacteroidales bacterium]
YNEAWSNDNGMIWSPRYSAEELSSMPDVDWHDAVLREASPYMETNVSVKGGDENARYFVSMDYMDQTGLYDVPSNDTLSNAHIGRFNLRANLDVNLGKYIEASVGVGGRIENRRYPNRGAGDLWNDMAKYPSSVYPIRNPDKSWTGTPVYANNPVASINALGKNSTHDRTLQFSLKLKEKLDFITDGLYLQESISLSSWTRDAASNTRNYARYYNGIIQTTDLDTPYSKYENSGTNQWNWKHFTVTAGYDREFGKNSISASVTGLYNIYNTDINQNADAGSLIYYRHANISGAVAYSYDNRLSALFTWAASGSDNYCPENRWGFYPALSLGYTILNSESNVRGIDLLKVRASAGRSGWDPMGEKRFLWESYWNHSGGVSLGNGSPSWNEGFTKLYEANPDIFAESSMKYDVGVNASFLGGRLAFDGSFFLENRSGIVTQDTMTPGAAGIENPAYRNIGKVTNKGFDLTISWSDRIGDFSYGASFIASYASNRIDYMAEIVTIASKAQTGRSIGSVFGYVADGFYDVSDFDQDGNLVSSLPAVMLGKVQPGDVKYRDLTKDGVIDAQDETFIGNSTLPVFNGSLALSLGYKGFDFSVLLQGAAGRDVNLLDAPLKNIAFRDNGNVYEIAEGRWAYYPDQGIDTRESATYPRLSLEDNNNNYQNSTLWMRSGDFVKVRNIELGYTLPKRALKAMRMSDFRVFVRGLNLLTFSPLTSEFGIDPEVISGHPALKSYNLGINLTF